MQIIVEPLSGLYLLDGQAGLTVGEGSEVKETPDDDGQDTASGGPHAEKV